MECDFEDVVLKRGFQSDIFWELQSGRKREKGAGGRLDAKPRERHVEIGWLDCNSLAERV